MLGRRCEEGRGVGTALGEDGEGWRSWGPALGEDGEGLDSKLSLGASSERAITHWDWVSVTGAASGIPWDR